MNKEKGFMLIELVLALTLLGLLAPTFTEFFSTFSRSMTYFHASIINSNQLDYLEHQLTIDFESTTSFDVIDETLYLSTYSEGPIEYQFKSSIAKRIENGTYTTNIPLPTGCSFTLNKNNTLFSLLISHNGDTIEFKKHGGF